MNDICFECGGDLEMRDGYNRNFRYRRDVTYTFPKDFLIPTCLDCGEIFITKDIECKANKIFKEYFIGTQKEHLKFLIAVIQKNADANICDIEKACGVQLSYLNRAMNGLAEADDVLIGLLESFALYPEEFKRRLNRKNAHDTESVRSVINIRLFSP